MTIPDTQLDLQGEQYSFPYHYLIELDDSGLITIHKHLSWGIDYMTYISFTLDLVNQRLKPQTALDVGCGDGRLINLLRGKVPQLVGVDIVEQAILFARAFNPGISFYLGDIDKVPGQYEVVTLIEVMEHISDDNMPVFIQKVINKISPGGNLIISVPTKNAPLARKHYRQYDLPLLQETLSPGLVLTEHWYLSRIRHGLTIWGAMLQNKLGIILPRTWRRLAWRMHKRFSYYAKAEDAQHLLALAEKK